MSNAQPQIPATPEGKTLRMIGALSMIVGVAVMILATYDLSKVQGPTLEIDRIIFAMNFGAGVSALIFGAIVFVCGRVANAIIAGAVSSRETARVIHDLAVREAQRSATAPATVRDLPPIPGRETYLIAVDGSTQGPVTIEALRQLRDRGTISDDSWTLQQGATAWRPLAAVLT